VAKRDTDRPEDGASPERSLPELAAIRPRARTETGDPAVEVRFSNGARIRYRAAADGIREAWFGPNDDDPARTNVVEAPALRGDDASATDRRSDDDRTGLRLSDRALCAIGSYLSFEGRRRASFVWGERNVSVLTGGADAD
jgi:hypothetical protein